MVDQEERMYEAVAGLSRIEGFMATAYALRCALVNRGLLSPDEINNFFCEWAENQKTKPPEERIGN